jgi:hypothetical protein
VVTILVTFEVAMHESNWKKLEAMAKELSEEERAATSTAQQNAQARADVQSTYITLLQNTIDPTLRSLAVDLGKLEGTSASVASFAPQGGLADPHTLVLRVSRKSGASVDLRVGHDGKGNVTFEPFFKTGGSTSPGRAEVHQFKQVTAGTIESAVTRVVQEFYASRSAKA